MLTKIELFAFDYKNDNLFLESKIISMKPFIFLLVCVSFLACKQADTSPATATKNIADSKEYADYIAAFQDYKDCVAARPQLTNDLMSKKITTEQFEVLLEQNTAVCSLRYEIASKYFEILNIVYPENAGDLKLNTDSVQ